MKQRKFMLCQYPAQGFGGKSGQYYLIDMYGNRYDIVDKYDDVLKEMNKVVRLGSGLNNTYCETSLDELISTIEVNTESKIERW